MPLKCTKSIPASLVRSLKISSAVMGSAANPSEGRRAAEAPILTKSRRLKRFSMNSIAPRTV